MSVLLAGEVSLRCTFAARNVGTIAIFVVLYQRSSVLACFVRYPLYRTYA